MNGENSIALSNDTVVLYHGSKSGIRGSIAPISRELCDFGRGFYMGTDRMQPLTLIANYPEAVLYTLQVDLAGLKLLEVEVGLEWALLVAYNRGKMESVRGTEIYNQYSNMTKNYDIVTGYIANDRMFIVLERFFNGEITDKALINSLSALKLGKQYVALTNQACEQIHIMEEQRITPENRGKIKVKSEENRRQGISLADEICRRYRRDGRFFDEILNGD